MFGVYERASSLLKIKKYISGAIFKQHYHNENDNEKIMREYNRKNRILPNPYHTQFPKSAKRLILSKQPR